MYLIPRNPYPHTLSELTSTLFKRENEEKILRALLKKTGHQYGFFTKSARNAMYLILNSLLKKNDEIIITAFTCNALVGPIKKSGVKPIFADISKKTLNSEFEQIKPLINRKTKAIVVTHQFGYPIDLEKLSKCCKEKDILLIEDAAAAIGSKINGSKVGTYGDIIFFSFEKSKIISCITGGMICFNNKTFLKKFSHLKEASKKSSLLFFLKALIQNILFSPLIYPLSYCIFKLIYKSNSNAYSWKESTEDYELSYGGFARIQLNLLSSQFKKIDAIIESRNAMKELTTKYMMHFTELITTTQELTNKAVCVNSRIPILINKEILKSKDQVHHELLKYHLDLGYTFSYMLPSYFKKKSHLFPNTEFVIKRILNIPIASSLKINNETLKNIKKYMHSKIHEKI